MAQPQSTIQRSFAGGELAPALHARADQARYVTGLRTCKNFVVRREGGVENRAGTRFVRACKTTSATVQLLRYVGDVEGGSLLIENGNGYFRFFKDGALVALAGAATAWAAGTAYVIGDLVSHGGVNYYCREACTGAAPDTSPDQWYPMPAGNILELPCPFATDLPHWEQNGNVLTLTKRGKTAYELIYQDLTSWVLRPVTTAPTLAGPTGLALTPGGGAGTRTYAYCVTAAAAATYEESVAGSVAQQASIVAPTVDAPHSLTWTAVSGAAEYYVYCSPYGNGVYGYIGTAATNSFKDTGFVPDFAVTPPLPRTPIAAANDRPDVAGHYQQRRFFANSVNVPDGVHGSRTGFYSNFAISSPLQDDDAISFVLAGSHNHAVRWLRGLKELVVGTAGGVWTVGQSGTPLSPSTLPADQHTYGGVAPKRPIVRGNSIVYVQARGTVLRDVQFDQQVQGLNGADLTLFSTHLFEHASIAEIDYQEIPHSVVWAVRSDGTLLGLTYLPEQEVLAWHRHSTQQNTTVGVIEHICVVPETHADTLYLIVYRGIGGVGVRYIEKLESRVIDPTTFDADCFFVDCGLSYSGAPVSTVMGLTHLEGQVVAVVADGAVLSDGNPAGADAAAWTVSGGAIALGGAYSHVHVGLAIRYADLETLDLDVEGVAVRANRKRVQAVTLLLDRSCRSFRVGPDADHLVAAQLEPWQTAADEYTGVVTLNLTSEFGDYGRIFLRHSDPLPLTILGVLPLVELGG